MGSITEVLDRINKVQAYWDGAEGRKKYPKRKVIDLLTLLNQKVPEIDWASVNCQIEDDD